MRHAKTIVLPLAIALSIVCGDAGAWWFVFIPGSVTSKIGDVLTGAEGENCVAATAKVGDILSSPSGNTATIKSLSGTSSRCQDAALPIRALLEFNYSFSSNVGIELPDDFKPKELNSTQRYNGALLHGFDELRSIGLFVSARPRKPGLDGGAVARSVADSIIRAIDDGKVSDEEELTINGLRAFRFQAEGKNKGIFGQRYTYVVTVLEGATEYVVLNANCPSDDFSQHKGMLQRFAFDVKGMTRQQQAGASQANPIPVGLAESVGQAPALEQKKDQTDASATQTVHSPAVSVSRDARASGIADRLRTLEKLLKEKLITQQDYDLKRQEILRDL